ncbi:MAG TPA: hypothetical protein VEQ87_07705, partial [Burkholderiales bacterium]|nr:hypothetical protein [Burkholderiales bacterium]
MLRTAAFCLVLGVAGTVSADEAGVLALTVTDTRLGFRGFSVAPPQAENWYLRKAEQGLWFLKRMDPQKYDPKLHTFAATVFLTKAASSPQSAEEFLALRKKRDVTEGGRFKLLKH